jgi:hypothetical protein
MRTLTGIKSVAGVAAAAILCLPAAAQMNAPPPIGAGQIFAVADELISKNRTKMTGTGLGYALPAPSQGEFSQTIYRTVSLLVVDTAGAPSQFAIKYNAIGISENGVQTADPLVGRSFEARASGGGVEITGKDGKALSDADRSRVAEDAQKFRDYLLAAARFSSLNISGTDFQDVSAPFIGNLMGLAKGEVKTISIRKRPGATIPTFDVRMAIVAQQSEGGEISVSGTMTIQPDWSALDVAVENKATRRSGSDKDKIQFVVDTSWSLGLSRKMIRK